MTDPTATNHKPTGLHARIESWIVARQRITGREAVLHRRILYILPTRHGVVFAGILVLMLLGAINYSNSMAFMLTFLLAGLGANAMWHTHRNLLGLRITRLSAQPVFAGETAIFNYLVDNPSHVPRRNILLERKGGNIERISVPARAKVNVALSLPTQHRGMLKPPRLLIHTRYPLGLFRTWSWLPFAESVLVYPRPIQPGAILDQAGDASGRRTHRLVEGDDFSGLRNYQHGDSPKRLDWKASARSIAGDLYTKQFSREVGETTWIEWDALPIQDPELRLSMLCYQILEAHGKGLRYGLRIPGTEVKPDSTERHRLHCLGLLATFAVS